MEALRRARVSRTALDDAACPPEDHFFPLYRALRAAKHTAIEVAMLRMDHGARPLGMPALAKRLADWAAAPVGRR